MMHLGACPAQSRLTTPNRPLRAKSDRIGEGQKIASFRWLALRPEGPGAVPLGKDCKALTISSSEMRTAGGTREDGMGGGAACGCFPSMMSNTLVDVGVMPAEERIWIALQY